MTDGRSPGEFNEVRAIYARAGLGNEVALGQAPAVVVVDFSCAFTDPTHPLGADVGNEIGATNQLLAVARRNGRPVIFTTIAFSEGELERELWIRKVPSLADLRLNSPVVEIDPRLERRPTEPVIVKRGPSAFFGTNLAGMLVSRGIDTVIICGATTSGCVRATVVDALQYQWRPVVPRDCVADRHRAPHEANLFDIDAKYGAVLSLSDVLAYVERIGPRQDLREHA